MLEKIIEVKKLVKKYKKANKPAVDSITFDVKKGEFFALLGPNGAGKTTIISILTTILNKSGGEVKIVGFDIDKEADKIRKNIGIIFQNPSLDLNLTAEENIRFHALIYGLYPFRPSFSLMPEEYRREVFKLAEIIGIKKDIVKPVKTFSGGMKRKLEIVRSLIHKPKILFLDEPTSGLDPVSRRNLWKYLQDIRKRYKTTIFLTTHYLEEAEDADRILIIDRGKIVTLGTPAKIKKELIDSSIILNAKDKAALKSELDAMKLDYEGHGPFKIKLNGKNPQKIIKSIRSDLTYLDINNPKLEDAYLKLIAKGIK